MASYIQDLIFTVLPNGQTTQTVNGTPGTYLKFSVLVSPRLTSDSSATTQLSSYPDWSTGSHTWPDTLSALVSSFSLQLRIPSLHQLPAVQTGDFPPNRSAVLDRARRGHAGDAVRVRGLRESQHPFRSGRGRRRSPRRALRSVRRDVADRVPDLRRARTGRRVRSARLRADLQPDRRRPARSGHPRHRCGAQADPARCAGNRAGRESRDPVRPDRDRQLTQPGRSRREGLARVPAARAVPAAADPERHARNAPTAGVRLPPDRRRREQPAHVDARARSRARLLRRADRIARRHRHRAAGAESRPGCRRDDSGPSGGAMPGQLGRRVPRRALGAGGHHVADVEDRRPVALPGGPGRPRRRDRQVDAVRRQRHSQPDSRAPSARSPRPTGTRCRR